MALLRKKHLCEIDDDDVLNDFVQARHQNLSKIRRACKKNPEGKSTTQSTLKHKG